MPATILALSTLRISSTTPLGQTTGTGFLFAYKTEIGQFSSVALLLITNKHVLENASKCVTTFSLLEKGQQANLTDNIVSLPAKHQEIELDISLKNTSWHPNLQIDLCAINVTSLFNQLSQTNDLRHFPIHDSFLPSAGFRQILRPIEQIVMVGYPNGLWDEVNNLPIIRKGLTATHPLISANGKPEFLVDCACFPGSSGSPIFLYEDGNFRREDRSYSPGTNALLLGVLYAGPQITIEGKIVHKNIPTGVAEVPVFNSMMNLGYAISVDEIAVLGKGLPNFGINLS